MALQQDEATRAILGRRKRARQRPRWRLLIAAVATLAFAAPVALAAGPAAVAPGQRIDLKVLLVSANGNADGLEPDFDAWKAELEREGVPYDTFNAYTNQTKNATLTDARLADYTQNHAKYQAVILSTGDLGHNVTDGGYLSALTDAEWTTLAKFERTFGIRQLSNYAAPSPAHGLNLVGTGEWKDGKVGTLTAMGKAAFPYLKGTVPIADDIAGGNEAFGYEGAPVTAANWETLVAGPSSTPAQPTAYLGVYRHPEDGREEMVMTVSSNQFQSQNQLLRHGMLSWVTRGVFLGYQRNYLEMQVDDVFLPDDAWDPVHHTTDYDPANAIRMSAADASAAVAWSKANGLRLDLAYNGFGSDSFGGPDALLAALQANKADFGWINHTYSHPNVDCSSQAFIADEITHNALWAQEKGFAVDASELVTGEHSGLANTRPGSPGTIDPPSFDTADPSADATSALASGSYVYGITATAPSGETPASVTAPVTVGAADSVDLSWDAVCHAASYKLYRATSAAGPWALIKTFPESPNASSDTGAGVARTVSYRDIGATPENADATPPNTNTAVLAPYAQNPNLVAALTSSGVKVLAGDASKTYPDPPASLDVTTGPMFAAGVPFVDGPADVIPRYPTNVYYNTATQAQQLDEFNWLYDKSGGCTAPRTDCLGAPLTFPEYVAGENRVMFRHIVGNDPRPHYFHQTNLSGTTTPGGGIFYQVIDPLLATYRASFADNAPMLQLTSTQIAQVLARQSAWAATLAGGEVTAWLQDGRIHVKNAGGAAVEAPLTGTTVGDAYGGQKSGWTTVAAGSEQLFSPNDPATLVAPVISGTPQVGARLSASTGTWSGTATITYAYQWQRCDEQGASCLNLPGQTSQTYDVVAADLGAKLRVIVSAANWISSVSQAASETFAVDAAAPGPAPGVDPGPAPATSPQAQVPPRVTPVVPVKLSLTKVRMSPRRFAVPRPGRSHGSRPDGSRITWRLNKTATVRLSIQRRASNGRLVNVGAITRHAGSGPGAVQFAGRIGKRTLPRGVYRLTLTARRGSEKSSPKRLSFTVTRR